MELVPPALGDVVRLQHAAVSRAQLVAAGCTDGQIEGHLDGKRWQRPYRGVYVVHTGAVERATALWAALLVCGPGATLSHRSAAEVDGLYDDQASPVHVTVPDDRRVRGPEGVRVHYAVHLDTLRHPTRLPPRMRVEETVLDIVAEAETATEVVDVVTRACQRRRTTASRIAGAAEARKKLRWRGLLEDLLLDVAAGAETALEVRYLCDVERAHGLPRGERQTPSLLRGRRWRDVLYQAFGVLVELDGKVAHPVETAHHDYARDTHHALYEGHLTLRYGWHATAADACGVAMQVASALQARGWTGTPRRCGPACRIVTKLAA